MKKKIIASLLMLVVLVGVLSACGKVERVAVGALADLDGKKIATQDGTTGSTYVKEELTSSTNVGFKKVTDLALELKNGKVDAIVLDELPAKKLVTDNPDFVILDEVLTHEEYAIAVRLGDKELLKQINDALAKITADGTLKKHQDVFLYPADGQIVVPEARPATTFPETINFGTNAEFAPFEYTVGDRIVGFDVELMNEIANFMGKNLKINNMNFDSLVVSLKSGQVDAVMAGMTADEQRKKEVAFSNTYHVSSQVVIVHKDSLKLAGK